MDRICLIIVFPFTVEDKESNVSESDGKTKTANPSKNENVPVSVDKLNVNKSMSCEHPLSKNTDDPMTNSQQASTNNSDKALEIVSTSDGDIKVEIKTDPDANQQTSHVASNNIQPALGSNLQPSHATCAKHPVRRTFYFTLLFLDKRNFYFCE